MPVKPKRPCAYPGCSRLAESGSYCEEHKKLLDKQYNRWERDPEINKRYDERWRAIRDRYMRTHPLCALCASEGRVKAAEMVHHIKPLGEGGTHEESNLMSLCNACHSRIHLEMRREHFG